MNILQIVPELRSGGVERGTVDFAKYLLTQGHGSLVVSAGGALVADLESAGVRHITMPVHKKSLITMWRQVPILARLLIENRIDLVHARSRVPAWIAFFACRRAGIPMVTTCHGVYSTHAFSRVMGWGKYVIAISHAVSRHMKENFKVPHHRIRLIHRGVNLSEFGLDPDVPDTARASSAAPAVRQERVIGIVGRVTPIKGHRVMIKAMARVARVFPDAKLWVVGDSPRPRYMDELKLMVRKLELQNHVEFLGTRQDIPDLMRRMSLLAAPAVGEEAFGRVLIEAGACGVPVIASRIGGIVDVIRHGTDGILVPAGDASALAENIIGVLKEPEYGRRLAESLRRRVREEFNDRTMFEKTIGVYRETLERKKILVIKLSALGDVILSTPSFRAIRNRYPQARIVALVERAAYPALKACPYVDDVLSFEKFGKKDFRSMLRIGRLLAREQFDVCVDLQNNRLSHLLSYLSGAHTRVGYANRRLDFFLNRPVKDLRPVVGPVEHQFQLLDNLEIAHPDIRPELTADAVDEEAVSRFLRENWLGENQTLVGINPGSSPLWKTKQWPQEAFIELCDLLAKENVRVVVTGTKDDLPAAEAIARQTRTRPIIAAGRTSIGELIALIRRCRVFVTSDSAPMHIATAVGTPAVALFGPTDPRRHVAPGRAPISVVNKEVKCSPCYLKKCPIGLICMKQILPSEVLERILAFLRPEEGNARAVETAPVTAGSGS
jgi:lipopolysaccharide heptosyltransferase II